MKTSATPAKEKKKKADALLCSPVPCETWTAEESAALAVLEPIKPSVWAEKYFEIRRGKHRGSYRNANAPQWSGVMDIATTRGCVQANIRAPGQTGKSTALRVITGWKAHTDPAPMGLTLPNRDKGRKLVKSDWLPIFRHTEVLRELIGQESRDLLIETVKLLNGFQLDLMWSGSATSLASDPMQLVINDEVDKFEPWSGDEPDAVAATEIRLTSYEDQRLQINTSTPTTTAGKIHQLYEDSNVKLLYHVPCPHCGHFQPLRWNNGMQWLNAAFTGQCVEAAATALDAGETTYTAGDSVAHFANLVELAQHLEWLRDMAVRFESAKGRRAVANLLGQQRDLAVWYVCEDCAGRIMPKQRGEMVRRGRWSTAEGFVTDYWGNRHEDAATVERWPHETRIGFHVSALYCLWIRWGSLVAQWLQAQDNPAALFAFITNRLAEAFEFRSKRVADTIFSDKSKRATLDAGIVPRWAWMLLCTVDTQLDHLYAVVRAWGAGLRSQRIWHGKLLTFSELDHLVLVKTWPHEDDAFPPMSIGRLDSAWSQFTMGTSVLIDSGGTSDNLLDTTRTQQVYDYVLERQPIVRAIKGANKPLFGLYQPMKNPMASGVPKAERGEEPALQALMVDKHRCNDLLADFIMAGVPKPDARPSEKPVAPEQWLLNRLNDPEYNTHMSNMQRTFDQKSGLEVWTPRAQGSRHDYRDCEAYMIALAYLNLHLIPPEESEVLELKTLMPRAAAPRAPRPEADAGGGNDGGGFI